MIELNAERDVLRVSGYASLFERIDMSGDRVRRGAFAASILGLKNQKLPMLFGHETHNPIGVWPLTGYKPFPLKPVMWSGRTWLAGMRGKQARQRQRA